VPCPHFSHDSGDCHLLEDVPEDEEERAEGALDDPVNRDWCLSGADGYRNCPIYRKFLAELLP